jgi:hypothetical protein
LTRLLNFNSVVAITGEAAKQPKRYPDHQDRLYLCGREILGENIENRNGAEDDAHIKPQHNPVANPNVKMHITSSR